MTNEQILWKAINKAGENGYDGWKSFVPLVPPIGFDKEKTMKLLLHFTEKIIFSFDFAEAFWGKEEVCPYCGTTGISLWCGRDGYDCCGCDTDLSGVPKRIAWQYHLQQMVLEKDRLRYLEKFLE